MATTVSIQVGEVSSSVVYEDDAKVVEVLRRYYLYMKLGPVDLDPGQAMLDAVLGSMVSELARYGVQQFIDERRAALEEQLRLEAEAAIDFISSI